MKFRERRANKLTDNADRKHGPKRHAGQEPPVAQRLIPVRETKRYDFWYHPTLYEFVLHDAGISEQAKEAVKQMGPIAFYREKTLPLPVEEPEAQWGTNLVNLAELALYESRRPYYKVWPSITEALCHTEMRIDGSLFRIPYDAIEVRMPKLDNPLWPMCALVAALFPGDMWSDGREQSLVIVGFDNVPEFMKRDDCGQYWIADMPIRQGLSLEDALDQTALAKDAAEQDTPRKSLLDPGVIRQMMRVVVGVSFFATDRHEVILPEVPRRVIERYQGEKKAPNASESKQILDDAKKLGMFGWKVGSEISLPRPVFNQSEGQGLHGERTTGHIRRGHLKLQPCGEKSQDRKLIFVSPTIVRPDLPLQSSHGYRVKI